MSTEVATKPSTALSSLSNAEFDCLDSKTKSEISILIKSGMFGDSKDIYKAIAKVKIGQTMGLDAANSLRGIYLQSNGTPTFTANLMSYLIKKSKIYDYTAEISNDKVTIKFQKKRDGVWVDAGVSDFGLEDAKLAGLAAKDTFKKFPRNMYFARALSNGARWYCPDVFGGNTAYTPDEIPGGQDVDGETLEVVSYSVNKPSAKEEFVGLSDTLRKLIEDTQVDQGIWCEHYRVKSLEELTTFQQVDFTKKLEIKKKADSLNAD